MANTIQLKRSATASSVPSSGSLVAGELAVNTADGKLYLKKDDTSVVQIGGPAAAGTLTGATLASNVLASSLTSVGTLTAVNTSGVITGTNTTASTSSATGAVIIAGGVGIAKDSFVNGLRVGIGGTGTGLVTSNAAFGKDALTGNTGTATIGIGENAGSGNTGGSNCVFIGQNSGVSNTANSTLGIGTYSMYQNTGSACVGVGIDALYSNNGDHCVAIGYATLAYNGIGNQGVSNTAIGYFAGNVNSSGARSTFIGRDAGVLNTTGSDQVFVGSDAGDICTTGTQNTVLGSQADLAANNNNNSIVIGYNAVGLGTNTTVIGNSSTTANRIFGVQATGEVAPTIASAATIAPTKQITFISGTTAVVTITAPTGIATTGGQITLIPTGIFTTTTAGNIALASTAVVSRALIMTYDATTAKWYPSY
jgi:hypothetical protein